MDWDTSLMFRDWNAAFARRSFWIDYNRLIYLSDQWKQQPELSQWQRDFKQEIDQAYSETRDVYSIPEDYDNYDDIEELFEYNTIMLEFSHDYRLSIAFGEGEFVHLEHPSFDEPLHIGRDDGHFMLPIVRQQELPILEQALITHDKLPFDPQYLPLLLAKYAYITQDADMQEVVEQRKQAWRAVGLFDEHEITMFVNNLAWTANLAWEHDAELGWVFEGDHCFRSRSCPSIAKAVTEFFDKISND